MTPVIGLDKRVRDFLAALGVENVDSTGRIIIDVPIDDVVCVYVTRIADAQAFDLRFERGAFRIVTVDRPPPQEP